ncbi:MAG: M42 family metallopeptidase [Oscillospiraceae bacterium]
MIELLKNLCMLNGISGNEDNVREYIIDKINGKCEYHIDNLGNIIVFKKGKKTSESRLMVSAHMDEVGMIITYINDDGTFKISPVGGIDPRVVFGRRVTTGNNNILGVIGGKAVHNLSADERKKSVSFEEMNVDIGCFSKEEAENVVSLGDSVCFVSDFYEFGENKIKGKAIDDRAGCAMMIEMINGELEYDTWFTFVVQEEVGLRGASVAVKTVRPDYAIVLESTTAADVPSAFNEKQVCKLENGPVVSFMDRHTIYDKELYNMAFEAAKDNGIPCQTKTMVAGGNDAGAIHLGNGGVRTAAISLPCRYLHSPSSVIDKNDFYNSYKLVNLMLNRICSK